MDERTTGRASAAAALALGLGLSCGGGPVPGAGAQQQQQQQQQQEVAPCRVQRGDRHVQEEGSAAVGRTTLGACARAIRAGSGSGAWGPHEVEVDADGRVRVNGGKSGCRTGRPATEGGGPGRG